MNKVVLLLVFVVAVACTTKSKEEERIAAIPIDIELLKFDEDFGNASVKDLSQLKKEYPAFFPKQYHDSIWIKKIQDTLQQQLFEEVSKKYSNKEKLKKELASLFKHIKYYFPKFETPLVVTTTSDVDYREKIILADSMLIIKLDTYLGSDHFFYYGIPKYISENMKKSQIVSDVASIYAQKFIPKLKQRTFLDQLIYYGKILYLKDLWITNASDAEKIGYTNEEIKWAEDNELEIWINFVENEYFYSTNSSLPSRFLNPAPFSKFYLEIDNDSPGRIGRYIGWQIVKSYVENNSVILQEMLAQNADEIFNKSKYKPKK